MRRLLLAALLVVMVMPASASAVDVPFSTATPIATRGITDSLKVAAQFWGAQPPCPTGVHVYVAGLTSLQSPDGARTAGGTAVDCRIWLDPSTLDNMFDAPWNYQDRIKRCDIIVHEFGHLVRGPDHSPNARSIMAPETNIEVYVMGCYQRFKPKRISRDEDREAFSRRIWAVR